MSLFERQDALVAFDCSISSLADAVGTSQIVAWGTTAESSVTAQASLVSQNLSLFQDRLSHLDSMDTGTGPEWALLSSNVAVSANGHQGHAVMQGKESGIYTLLNEANNGALWPGF
jgi:hypothetical protein